MATKKEQEGRKGDKVLAHLTPGEVVVPRAFAEDKDFKAILFKFFKSNNADPAEFTVGSGKNKVNPKTGYVEFGFLGGVSKSLRTVFGLVKDPKTPNIPEQEEMEEISVVEEGAEEERRRERKKLFTTGRMSTILSGIKSALKKRLGE